MKQWKGITALSAALVFSSVLTMAVPGDTIAGNSISMDSAKAGIMIPLNHYFASSMNPEDEIKNFLENGQLESEPETEAPTQAPTTQAPTKPPSPYANVAISRVSNYVNIRDKASTSGKILGKIYNNCAATILDTVEGEDGTWYYIKSGSVKGYMKAEFFVTGEAAEKIAKEVGTVWATTTATTLRLREKASTSSRTLSLLAHGEKYIVEEEGIVNDQGEEFVKITIDEGDNGGAGLVGYVASKYVSIKVVFEEAISIEEEKAELERQEQLRKEAEEAKKKLEEQKKKEEEEAAKKTSTTAKPTQKPTTSTKPSSTQSSSTAGNSAETNMALREAIVAYAKQFVGGKYVWGGNDLNTGVDCSGFVREVYKHFGINTLPRQSKNQAASPNGKDVAFEDLKIGDLIFFAGSDGVVNHVAMFIGNGQVVHAASTRLGIIISEINYRTACRYKNFID